MTGLNGVKWWPGILRKPVLAMKLFDGDFSSPVSSGQAALDLSVDALEKMNANARRFIWAGATITIWAGSSGDAWPWVKVFSGRADAFKAQGNQLSLTAEVDAEPFAAQVLSLTYAGTGGAEGDADIKGKPKPWAFGAPRNVEPVLIDSVNSVFQVSAYGAIKAVETLYERGAAFSASFGDYSTYANLVAANIPAGRWATCLNSGLIRLGAPPYGVITADIQGDYQGSTWRRLPGAIIQRICSQLGISSSRLNLTSLNALDSFAASLPGGGNISLYLTSQADVMDLARQIALGFNAQAGVSWIGNLFISRVEVGSPVATLDAQQHRLPRVVESVETDVSPPYSKIQMGGERSWRVHNFDEIAFQAELIDRGEYSASTVYREGNIVSLTDGSRWVFVGVTPVANSLPSDANANWSRMTSAVQQAAIDALSVLVADAQATADAKRTVFYQASAPTAAESEENDLWINSADGNRLYRRVAGAGTIEIGGAEVTIGGQPIELPWTLADDQRIGQAILDAAGAQATADGKVESFTMFSATEPEPVGTGIGDLLCRLYLNPIQIDRWDGDSWEPVATYGATAAQAAGIISAIDAADAAQTTANTAQANASTALTELANIASDSLLTPDEKPRVIQDRDVITAEQAGIDAQANTYGITTEKTAYDSAVSALTSYLATLTSPVLWSNLTGNTTIVGTTFSQKFKDVYDARQILLNKIANEAGKRADWSLISNIPYEQVISNRDDVALGFNTSFAAWTGSYPVGWQNWIGGAPVKETSIVRVGANAVRMTASGSDRGIYADSSFTTAPLPVGTFLSGAVDIYMVSRTSGLPGIMVRLYTNAAKTTYVDTKVQPPETATGAWQRVPWAARVGAGQRVYGIRIYLMASWTGMPSGSFTGDVIFDNLPFALFDTSTDNTAISIAANGALTGAGGGQVTITGLGYTGDLNATHGADWNSNLANIPYDDVLNNDDSTTLGFNGSFEAWGGSLPDGWSVWTTSAGVSKETSIVRFGSNAVRIAATGAGVGLQASASWTGSPMPAGTILSGNIDFYLVSRTSGLPGILVRLYTNAGLTTYVDTKVQPASTGTGSWQTIPWLARVGAAQQIYGIHIYLMGSWSGFASGSFTGTAIFDRMNFAFFNSGLDNQQISIAANGSLSGGGGGQVTITGLGYSGDLDATKGAPSGTNVGGTSATTVESGANAANNGVNSDGTIKTDKVGTGSIAPNSVTAPGQVALVSPFDVSTKNAWVDVLTQTLTVSGQPGQLSCYWDAVAVDPGTPGFSFGFFYMRLLRDAVVMKQWLSSGTFIDSASNANDVAVCEVEKFISLLDTPSAGSRTYKLQAYLVSGSGEWPSDSYLRALPGTNILLVDLKR